MIFMQAAITITSVVLCPCLMVWLVLLKGCAAAILT